MRPIRFALLTALLTTACGAQPPSAPPLDHPPATRVDDDGYLVRSALLTITPGIPHPYTCYNGFDPYHNANPSGSFCANLPNSNTHLYTNLITSDPNCSLQIPPAGWTYLRWDVYGASGWEWYSCAKVSMSYTGGSISAPQHAGYWSYAGLSLNGWLAWSNGGTSAFTVAFPTQVVVPPNAHWAWTTAPYLNPTHGQDPCAGIDPDEDICVSGQASGFGQYVNFDVGNGPEVAQAILVW